eukprot:m.10815 g.10815  ORF g.10815 m.10815 type:complete len:386 (+) comp8502_c0_seq1:351-1508(+)
MFPTKKKRRVSQPRHDKAPQRSESGREAACKMLQGTLEKIEGSQQWQTQAKLLESTLFDKHPDTRSYDDQLRTIMSNLHQGDLGQRLIANEFAITKLATMSSQDMRSERVKQLNEQADAHEIRDATIKGEDLEIEIQRKDGGSKSEWIGGAATEAGDERAMELERRRADFESLNPSAVVAVTRDNAETNGGNAGDSNNNTPRSPTKSSAMMRDFIHAQLNPVKAEVIAREHKRKHDEVAQAMKALAQARAASMKTTSEGEQRRKQGGKGDDDHDSDSDVNKLRERLIDQHRHLTQSPPSSQEPTREKREKQRRPSTTPTTETGLKRKAIADLSPLLGPLYKTKQISKEIYKLRLKHAVQLLVLQTNWSKDDLQNVLQNAATAFEK